MEDYASQNAALVLNQARIQAEFQLIIEHTGTAIAAAKGWKHLKSMEAVHRYLTDKYCWLPSQVRSLTIDEIFDLLDGPEIEGLRKKGGYTQPPKVLDGAPTGNGRRGKKSKL
jgi:hypothetical protein